MTSSRRFKDVFKTSLKCIQDLLSITLFLLTRLQDMLKAFSRAHAKTIIYIKLYLGRASEKFMVSVQILQE